LLSLLSQLLGLAGVVGCPAVPVKCFPQGYLDFISPDLDADVTVSVFRGVDVLAVLRFRISGLFVSADCPIYGIGFVRTRSPIEGVVVRHIESFRLLRACSS